MNGPLESIGAAGATVVAAPELERPHLSVVIPAHNEEENLPRVVPPLLTALRAAEIRSEIIVVNDNSRDGTAALLETFTRDYPEVRAVHRRGHPGFGLAIREGMACATGEAIAIVMGDCSDDADDVVRMYQKLSEGYDAVFGSRFIRGGSARNYPFVKWVINRLANSFLQVLFRSSCNDLTNAFKLYRREVLEAMAPIETEHFDITAELPLKTLKMGCRVAVIPIQWYGRTSGVSKLGILKMARHYLATVLKVKWAFRPDASRQPKVAPDEVLTRQVR